MKLIKLVLGSVRDGRAGEKVATWLLGKTSEYRGDVKFELIDLAEVNLPFMNEPVPPAGSSDYKYEHTKRWSRLIDEADGFIFITPEYNHGYSGVLKNALDFLYKEWKNKPVLFVGYGGGGASNSIRQLKEVVEFLGMHALSGQINISKIWEAFDKDGKIIESNISGDIEKLLAELDNKAEHQIN